MPFLPALAQSPRDLHPRKLWIAGYAQGLLVKPIECEWHYGTQVKLSLCHLSLHLVHLGKLPFLEIIHNYGFQLIWPYYLWEFLKEAVHILVGMEESGRGGADRICGWCLLMDMSQEFPMHTTGPFYSFHLASQ